MCYTVRCSDCDSGVLLTVVLYCRVGGVLHSEV